MFLEWIPGKSSGCRTGAASADATRIDAPALSSLPGDVLHDLLSSWLSMREALNLVSVSRSVYDLARAEPRTRAFLHEAEFLAVRRRTASMDWRRVFAEGQEELGFYGEPEERTLQTTLSQLSQYDAYGVIEEGLEVGSAHPVGAGGGNDKKGDSGGGGGSGAISAGSAARRLTAEVKSWLVEVGGRCLP